MKRPKVLYISYDGISDPLGYSQVFKYLKELNHSFEITLISFEKRDRDHLIKGLKNELADAGIHWYPLRYHKRPTVPATIFDLSVGLGLAFFLKFRSNYRFIHARSYPATLIAWILHCLLRTPYLFDIRGFWPEEKLECGDWTTKTLSYRFFSWIEKHFLVGAAHIISLTDVGKKALIAKYPGALGPDKITVIPTCADLKVYSAIQNIREQETFTLGYVGSALRYRFDAAVDFFLTLSKIVAPKSCRLLILNQGEHETIRETMKKKKVDFSFVDLVAVPPKETPKYYGRMSAVVLFADASYSKLAMSPTKLGELLACHVPCVVTPGIGDTEALVRKYEVGVVAKSLDPDSIQSAAIALIKLLKSEGLGARCQSAAEDFYTLSNGVKAYERVYDGLIGRTMLPPSFSVKRAPVSCR